MTSKTNNEKNGNGEKSHQHNETHENNGTKNKHKPKVNATGDILCFNCQKYGHISRDCPLPPRKARCSHCQRTTHESKDCLTKSQGSTKQILATETQLANPALNEKYFKEALLNGIQVRHGAGKTIPIGRLNARIIVDSASDTTEIYVVPDSAQTIPLLIGQPFTEQSHITVVRRNNTLRIFNETHDEEDECLKKIEVPELQPQLVNLWAKSATVFPTNYIGSVEVYTQRSSELYIEPQLRSHFAQEHRDYRCIVTINGEGRCPVANVLDHERIIEENKMVTKAEICQPPEETNKSQTAILANEVSTLSHSPKNAFNGGTTIQENQLKELHLLYNAYRNNSTPFPSELRRTNEVQMTTKPVNSHEKEVRPEQTCERTKSSKSDRYHIGDVPQLQRDQRSDSKVATVDKLKRWLSTTKTRAKMKLSYETLDPDKSNDAEGTRNSVTIQNTSRPDDHRQRSINAKEDNSGSSGTSEHEGEPLQSKVPCRLPYLNFKEF